MPTERMIPKEKVLGLKETLSGDSELESDFEFIEDLISTSIISNNPELKELAKDAVSGFLGTPIDIFTMTTEDRIFVYITLNHIEECFWFVGSYPNTAIRLEEVPDQRTIEALKTLAKKAIKS